MAAEDLVIRARRVLTSDGTAALEVAVRDGKIVALEPFGAGLRAETVIELADDETLLPGLVDAHVHINEPGRTEWEGFATATRAAAAGGVTTVIDMPLNAVPPTVDPAALAAKRAAAEPQIFVDVGFWAGAVPGNLDHVLPLHEQGVFGFKYFMLPSGVDEFQPLPLAEIEPYLQRLRECDGLLIVHAEDPDAIARAPQPDGASYAAFVRSRPRGAENLAIAMIIERTRWTGARTHILHLSSADALPMLRTAKADGLDLTVETCPHYLTLAAETIPDGATAYKCCPPIRELENQDRLWEGLLDGTIDYVASDHSPSTLELKELDSGDFGAAWGGIASLQLGLSLIWTEARRRGIGLERVIEWMATKPAERVGLPAKGRIAPGRDADLVVFAPDETFVVDQARLQHRNPLTPYHGTELTGVIRQTFVGGRAVDYRTPGGRLLRHEAA